MRVIVQDSPEAVGRRSAELIAELIARKPDCVLGLATGSTPLGTYRELIRMHREDGLDFSRVTTFNLDEYVGLPPTHPQSYRYYMDQNFFQHINIEPSRTNVPDGRALDFEAHCRAYEQKIQDCGGIDLQLLGIGSDGHIAFNEPGSSLGSRTRLKTLAMQTIVDNARFFADPAQVPMMAITMGVGTILDSRQCLLIAIGQPKSQAIRDTIEGPVTSQVTASALQLHRDVICVLDAAAANKLRRLDYYAQVELVQQRLDQNRHSGFGTHDLQAFARP
jgi:glucosamine-6-phosphate deaminase